METSLQPLLKQTFHRASVAELAALGLSSRTGKQARESIQLRSHFFQTAGPADNRFVSVQVSVSPAYSERETCVV